MTENSRPSPFFSCGKMNLVILGISSTRTGLILTGILTMIQHSDPFVLHFLLWNWWGIVGISVHLWPIQENSKATFGWVVLSTCAGACPRLFARGTAQPRPSQTRGAISASLEGSDLPSQESVLHHARGLQQRAQSPPRSRVPTYPRAASRPPRPRRAVELPLVSLIYEPLCTN